MGEGNEITAGYAQRQPPLACIRACIKHGQGDDASPARSSTAPLLVWSPQIPRLGEFTAPRLEKQRVDDEGFGLREVLVQFRGEAIELPRGEKPTAEDPVAEDTEEL